MKQIVNWRTKETKYKKQLDYLLCSMELCLNNKKKSKQSVYKINTERKKQEDLYMQQI